VEAGRHSDLVETGGVYYRLVRNQLELEVTSAHAG
jgi:hypothetical protein